MGSYLTDQAAQSKTSVDFTKTDTPAWMQQAIYDQIANARNAASVNYEPYKLPTIAALDPNQTQAYSQIQQNSTNFNAPTGMNAGLTNAATAMKAYQNSNTATGLSTGQTNYLSPNTPASLLRGADTNWATAVGANPATAGTGNLTSSATSADNITTNANPALTNSLSSAGNITANANPYLTSAKANAYTDINKYMNPYQQNVMDTMAQQAGRNLSENLLPQVSDQFIKAGQFGGNRMGEFGARALRDTQQTLLQEQGKLANQGYTQALTANQADLARQATLGQTAGNLASQQAQAYQNVGQTQGQLATQQAQAYQNVGQTQGQLTAQQQQNLATIANQQAQQAGQQQQLGLTAAKDVQGAQTTDATRQMGALNDYTTILGNQQKMQNVDAASLEAAGQAQQAQKQAELTAAQQQWQQGQDYTKNQLDWMNSQIRGLPANTIPTTTTTQNTTVGGTYAPSVLQQLASGAALVKGLTG